LKAVFNQRAAKQEEPSIPLLKVHQEILHPSKTWQFRIATVRAIQVFDVRWSPDDELIAAGYVDGGLRFFTPKGKLVKSYNVDDQEDPECIERGIRYRAKMSLEPTSTITGLRWQPGKKGRAKRLASCDSKGTVRCYSVPGTGLEAAKMLWQQEASVTQHGPTQCLDWLVDGSKVLVGGTARRIYCLDPNSGDTVATCGSDDPSVKMCHANRILSIRAATHCPNTFLSAGWDNIVMMWDVRTAEVVRTFSKSKHVFKGGDPVDISQSGECVVSASSEVGGEILMWDSGGSGVLASTDMSVSAGSVTCCQFSKDYTSADIGVGTEGEASCTFVRRNDRVAPKNVGGRSWTLAHSAHAPMKASIWCMDFAHTSRKAAVGSTDGVVSIVGAG